jgi:RHS repeat-associated protein
MSSGSCTSGYDANGNLTSKTTSRGMTATYSYDALNRPTQAIYSDQTPGASYQYDISCCGVTFSNPIGRITGAFSGNTELLFSYDVMGRPVKQWDCPPSGIARGYCYVISAQYDKAGDLTSLTYPGGRVVNFTFNAAGQPLTAIDGSGAPYVSNAIYGPSGPPVERFMPNIDFRIDLNNRLQIAGLNASGAAYYLSKSYSYNSGQNNGNVTSIANNLDSNRSQSFAYDSLNRLISAQNSGMDCNKATVDGKTLYWGSSYGYDAWGNLLAMTPTKCGAESLDRTADGQNRLHVKLGADHQYDAGGNMTLDPDPTYGFTATYDAENRIQTVTKNKVAASYTYNAADNRVRKDVASSSTEYFYFGGGVIAERDLAGNWKDYVFFDGERVARIDQPNNVAHYYLSDALNSTSVVVGAGGIENESDYRPFGGELQISNNDPGNHDKFTGKELDAESGLYNFGARYYGPALGRFITPDPLMSSGHPQHPQSWNRYAYALNNPLRYVDPDGLDAPTDQNLLREDFCPGPAASSDTHAGCVDWKDDAELKTLIEKREMLRQQEVQRILQKLDEALEKSGKTLQERVELESKWKKDLEEQARKGDSLQNQSAGDWIRNLFLAIHCAHDLGIGCGIAVTGEALAKTADDEHITKGDIGRGLAAMPNDPMNPAGNYYSSTGLLDLVNHTTDKIGTTLDRPVISESLSKKINKFIDATFDLDGKGCWPVCWGKY